MTFPSNSTKAIQDQQSKLHQTPSVQSREAGDVLPGISPHGTSITKRESPVAKSWAHFVAGGLGGMTAAVLTSPLDVVKTRLQSDYYRSQIRTSRIARNVPPPSTMSLPRSAILHFRETFQILFSINRVEGWRALFKGLGPNLAGVVPARAINFYTYGNGKRLISSALNNGQEAAWVHLCAAACAGIVTSTATNPIWMVKTRLQLDKSHAEKTGSPRLNRQYRNSLDCTMQILRQEGVRGLYRGLSASYLGVTESTLQWVLYEQMKMFLKRRDELRMASGRERTGWDEASDWGGRVGAAGCAKFFAALVTYPHEVVRTRLRQAPLENGHVKYTGLIQCFRLIWVEEGLASMYGGLTPHLLRVVPSAAIMFSMYEVILRAFGTQA
ncbi:MAG: hypothetical protein M1836_007855 [Candelina mexicana]|nr:MAG: hypothetical protein M1836_007855 [Candelina mexicana]